LHVRGDAGRLEQVFLNLLTNAIDHAHGSATIDVAVRRSGNQARVEIQDHGQGIAPQDLAMLFEAYSRLGRAQRVGGLGLGLFVSREIVVAHGGEITATSRIGDGTTVAVTLPAEPLRAKPRRPAGNAPRARSRSRSAKAAAT
jgi:signal transduction histidine kinase